MREDAMDRVASALAGPPRPITLLERAIDRLTAVLAGSLGTRSWTS